MLATHIRSAPQTIHLANNFWVRRYGYAIRWRLRLFVALDERNKYGFAKRLLHGVQYGAFFRRYGVPNLLPKYSICGCV